MLDVKPTVVTALNTIGIDVSYELFYNSSSPVPCITYLEYLNSDDKTGDTFGYSNIGFTINIWTKTLADQAEYSQDVDKVMRNLGFKRVSAAEFVQDDLFRKVIDYKCLGRETY